MAPFGQTASRSLTKSQKSDERIGPTSHRVIGPSNKPVTKVEVFQCGGRGPLLRSPDGPMTRWPDFFFPASYNQLT
jgi:hypothetical protein